MAVGNKSPRKRGFLMPSLTCMRKLKYRPVNLTMERKMTQQQYDYKFHMVKGILESKGSLQQYNLLRIAMVYEDKKVYVEGLIDQALEDYERFVASIRLNTTTGISLNSESENPAFALSK